MKERLQLYTLIICSFAVILISIFAMKVCFDEVKSMPKISSQSWQSNPWSFGDLKLSLLALCVMVCTFSTAFFFLIFVKSIMML